MINKRLALRHELKMKLDEYVNKIEHQNEIWGLINELVHIEQTANQE